MRSGNPLARLKSVPKDQIKDGSLTLSDKKERKKEELKAGMTKATNVRTPLIT